jgi:hypothetical protein
LGVPDPPRRDSRAARHAAETDADALRRELAAIEPDPAPETGCAAWRLDGLSLLYVGGRPSQIAHMRAVSEQHGAVLAHHDGGVEHHPDLLSGLTSRADAVLFPVDCVSHDAALTVKRLCRQGNKRFIPLRSSGMASFLAAIRGLAEAGAPAS